VGARVCGEGCLLIDRLFHLASLILRLQQLAHLRGTARGHRMTTGRVSALCDQRPLWHTLVAADAAIRRHAGVTAREDRLAQSWAHALQPIGYVDVACYMLHVAPCVTCGVVHSVRFKIVRCTVYVARCMVHACVPSAAARVCRASQGPSARRNAQSALRATVTACLHSACRYLSSGVCVGTRVRAPARAFVRGFVYCFGK
jgi:hypothetical protein